MRKLIILCAALVVVGLSVSALANYTGLCIDPETGCIKNALHVDINGRYGHPTKCNWQGWDIGVTSGSWVSPVSKTFDNPQADYSWENPIVQLEAYRSACGTNPETPQYNGGSRERSGGLAYVGETGEYSSGSKGYGMNYLTLTITQLAPSTHHYVSIWGYESQQVWAMSTNNPAYPNTKFMAWSEVNPRDWLLANGYDGSNPGEPPCGGYGPPAGGGVDSNMPCGLFNTVRRASLVAPEGDTGDTYLATMEHRVTICVDSDEYGKIVLYGWIDPTDWTGSAHLPINGIMVVPEPATIALLGLGGLALLRRKR